MSANYVFIKQYIYCLQIHSECGKIYIMKDLSETLCKLGEFFKICDEHRVTLCLATKTLPKDYLVSLANSTSRHLIFAENKAQELRDKYFEADNVEWHFIGRLQQNKIKYLLGKVSLIQSVDSISLIDAIARAATQQGLIINLLIEVNIGNDPQKGGVLPSEYERVVRYASNLSGISVIGIMAVLPVGSDSYSLTKSAVELINKTLDIIPSPIISIGMSSDFLEALRGGSNMIRIGSSIFGKRS